MQARPEVRLELALIPLGRNVRGELSKASSLPSTTLMVRLWNSLLGQILRSTQCIRITRFKGVADDVDVLQRDRRVVIRPKATKNMT